jgi:uncharacterized membrane protein
MLFQFTHPLWLLALVPALGWVLWVAWFSDTSLTRWKRNTTLAIRILLVLLVVAALAGLQRREPVDSMNVFFLLDRSDSIPSPQQESGLRYVNEAVRQKELRDKAGVLVFAADAALETTASSMLDLQRINAVISAERTDIAAAIRLGTAAFPEEGQKRLVLVSDGNENVGDAMGSLLAARPLGVTLDVLPRGVERAGDASVEKVTVPSRLKKGQAFEPKVFIEASQNQNGVLRIYRNDQLLGEQKVALTPGKNLFSFSQQLDDSGFYRYDAQLEVGGDSLPQNNRGSAFTGVRGEPRVLLVSSNPSQDAPLLAALRSARLQVTSVDVRAMPTSLAELQSYEGIFLSNVAAGDLSSGMLRTLESLVRDFGVGLVCIGGDQAFTAGGYRGTPLEAVLPVGMELDSKKVLPKGAVAMVMHGMEFANGNQVARDCALGVLEALNAQDEMGVVLWDGVVRWLFELAPVGDKEEAGKQIAGMNQGDLPSFQEVMERAHASLAKSTANLKHMIVFSDGDPGPPTDALMQEIRDARITVTSVLISGHAGPDTMMAIAAKGNGRFYDVRSPDELPQIFLKEAAVILKSAIFEDPFQPKLAAASELIRGIPPAEYPTLRGYVSTSPKARAETPLVSDKGDPILAHWQYGLGRSVAFTSDAQAKWSGAWLSWDRYQQFWSQIAQWSLRRLDNAEFNTEVNIDKGEGLVTLEAVDEQGNYRNFLNLQAVVVSPKGERQTVRLEQNGAGRYQARFATREVGAYVLNVMEMKDGKVRASQVLGASVNFSPEFAAPSPNLNLLHRLAEAGGGKVLDPANPQDVPFRLNREKTFQAHDLWEWLLKIAVVLFTFDVGLRRVDLDPEDVAKFANRWRRRLFFWKPSVHEGKPEESLSALLARRDQVRSQQVAQAPDPSLFRPAQPVVDPETSPPSPSTASSVVQSEDQPPAPPSQPTSTTSRLLEAKRRAQKKPD